MQTEPITNEKKDKALVGVGIAPVSKKPAVKFNLCTENNLVAPRYIFPYLSAIDFWKIKFEKSNLTSLIFCPFQIDFLQATQAVKIKIEIDKKSSSSNLIIQTPFLKNQVQINIVVQVHSCWIPQSFMRTKL